MMEESVQAPTLRVSLRAMERDELGQLRFAGQLFSGIAYLVEADGMIRFVEAVADGRTVGFVTEHQLRPRVDHAYLACDDDGPLTYQGAVFDGLSCMFERDGRCLVEQRYRNGYPADDFRRTWYRSGAPRQLVLGEDGSMWFEDGALGFKRKGEATLLNLVVRDDGSLGAIVVAQTALFDVRTVARFALAATFALIGEGIDNKLLAALREQSGIAAVQRLSLIETSLDAGAIAHLAGFEGLQSLSLIDNPGLGADAAALIRQLRPTLTVDFSDGSELP